MIESAAYEIIAKEAFAEGEVKGRTEALYESAKILLEIKFGIEGVKLQKNIPKNIGLNQLELLVDIIRLAQTPEDVGKAIDSL